MSKKKKSTNSLTDLIEKSKNISPEIYTPTTKQQTIDESKILRPYLEPNNNTRSLLDIDHESTTYRPHIDHKQLLYRPHIDHRIDHRIDHKIDHKINVFRS